MRRAFSKIAFEFSRQTSGSLQSQQIASVNQDRSDHARLQVSLNNGTNIIVGNALKQCQAHNNGFKKVETEEEYVNRLLTQADELCDVFYKDATLFAAFKQEFAIKPAHVELFKKRIEAHSVPGLYNPRIYVNTTTGVAAFFREPAACAFRPIQIESDAVQLFRTSHAYCIANVHVPFRNTENAFKDIIRQLLLQDNLPEAEGIALKIVDRVGDNNLSPERQIALTREVCDEIAQERQAAGQSLFSVTSYLVSSPDGHLQDRDGKKEHVDVDSCHRLVIVASDHYRFEHHYSESVAKSKISVFISAIVSAGCVLMNSVDGLVGEVAVAALARNFERKAMLV